MQGQKPLAVFSTAALSFYQNARDQGYSDAEAGIDVFVSRSQAPAEFQEIYAEAWRQGYTSYFLQRRLSSMLTEQLKNTLMP